mmetsp:Transcript_26407/g.86380  ORF Transcript_26407/g.86380 Transcript_26407/m.86380 type:complete len:476 (+) Transcript_26407:35-1462(+)
MENPQTETTPDRSSHARTKMGARGCAACASPEMHSHQLAGQALGRLGRDGAVLLHVHRDALLVDVGALRRLVARGRDDDARAVRQRRDSLDDRFPKGPRPRAADELGPPVVLQRRREDLGRRGGARVDEQVEGRLRVHAVVVRLVGDHVATVVGHERDRPSLWQQQPRDVDAARKVASGIAAQVEHQGRRSLGEHVGEGGLDVGGCRRRELPDRDEADGDASKCSRRLCDCGELHLCPLNQHNPLLCVRRGANHEPQLGAGGAAHVLGRLLRRQPRAVLPVRVHDLVAWPHPGPVRRPTRHDVVDRHAVRRLRLGLKLDADADDAARRGGEDRVVRRRSEEARVLVVQRRQHRPHLVVCVDARVVPLLEHLLPDGEPVLPPKLAIHKLAVRHPPRLSHQLLLLGQRLRRKGCSRAELRADVSSEERRGEQHRGERGGRRACDRRQRWGMWWSRKSHWCCSVSVSAGSSAGVGKRV